MAKLVRLDSRSRLSLGELARSKHYIVTMEPDGTLVLTPAVVLPLDQKADVVRNWR